MKIFYQDNRTGGAFDLTGSVTGCTWTTKRAGYPAALDLSVLRSAEVEWSPGGVLAVRDGAAGLFYGYVFKIGRDQGETVTVTAYDQTRYLKNKDTYVFHGRRADEIVAQIAADFKLKTGALAHTGYVIPSMVEDAQTLFDIILKALDLTLLNTGRMFCLWDDFGALRLSEVAVPAGLPVVGNGSLATGYTYTVDIDGQTYNKIKLVRDNKQTGRRDVYIQQDSGTMALWGVLQNYEKVDENLNEAQVKQKAGQMLELCNRPARALELEAFALPEVRAGRVIYVPIEREGLAQAFLVEEAKHDLLKQTMQLKVKVV